MAVRSVLLYNVCMPNQKRYTPAALLGGAMIISCLAFCGNEMEPEAPAASSQIPRAAIPFAGKIVFQSNLDGDNEIFLLTENSLLQLTHNTWEDNYPKWAPDGEQIAFTANPQGNFDIFIMKGNGSEIRPVTDSSANEIEPSWFPDGSHLVYTLEDKRLLRKTYALYKVRLQTRKRRRLIPEFNNSHGLAHLSPDSTWVTFTGKRMMGWDVAVYDLSKNRVYFLDEGGKSCRARFSPGGDKLAYVSSKADGKGDIWMMNPDGSEKTRLTERDETYDYFPSWSPDGRFVVFNSSTQHDHDGDWALYIFEVQTGRISLLFDSGGSDVFADWHFD
jgi:Tol biopolymer transport system component